MELTVCPVSTEDTEWNFVFDPDDCTLSTEFLNEKPLFEPGTHCLRVRLFKKCRHGTCSARVSLYIQVLKSRIETKKTTNAVCKCSNQSQLCLAEEVGGNLYLE